MNISRPQLLIKADAPEALTEVCGVSFLERLLRSLQRLGFREGKILTNTPAEVAAHLAPPSWAREGLSISIVQMPTTGLTVQEFIEHRSTDSRTLLIDASIYVDARLLRTLAQMPRAASLVDGAQSLGSALVDDIWLAGRDADASILQELSRGAGEMEVVEVTEQDSYLPDMRRHLRPLWFAAPSTESQRLAAERLILDSAQKGTLDIPARVHAPIETWIISHLCRTRITPMQITGFGMFVAASVTAQFAYGWLWSGTLLALAFGIIDGLDGKQARVKVQTTQLGEWEHQTDYLLELSWWVALAWHFHITQLVPNALQLLLFFLLADWTDRITRGVVRWRLGRMQDDVAALDRFIRLLGGRRNIYIWVLAASLLFGTPANGFVVLCWWSVATAGIHLARAAWLLSTCVPAR